MVLQGRRLRMQDMKRLVSRDWAGFSSTFTPSNYLLTVFWPFEFFFIIKFEVRFVPTCSHHKTVRWTLASTLDGDFLQNIQAWVFAFNAVFCFITMLNQLSCFYGYITTEAKWRYILPHCQTFISLHCTVCNLPLRNYAAAPNYLNTSKTYIRRLFYCI